MKVTLDGSAAAAAYSTAFRRLQELPGFDHRLVLLAEAGSILKRWAGETKVGTQKQASFRARNRAGKRAFGYTSISKNPYGITVNTGSRGGFPGEVWYRHPKSGNFQQAGMVSNSGSFTPSWIHWKSEIWNRIHTGGQLYGEQLRTILPLAPKSIGFARQSVIQIADELGIDLSQVKGGGISSAGITKARAAIASSGKAYKNGLGYQGGDEVRCYIDIINRLPYGQKIGMDRSLARVLSGRAKFIETAYKKGAFASMRYAARSFPNIFNVSRLS